MEGLYSVTKVVIARFDVSYADRYDGIQGAAYKKELLQL
jgi:hypothetical protein